MNFTIRPPRVDEAESLADLHLRTWQETYAGVFPAEAWGPEARADRVRLWTEFCSTPRPDWRTAVAEIDGRPVGIAHSEIDLEKDPIRPRVLALIYLLASAQGSGAGQALLDEVLGDEPGSLWVLEENPRARAFYAKNRFVADGTRKHSPLGGTEIRMLR